ncbi:DUF4156 domain-containing protein [Vibrio sonorensis]|uniref:DUF4156 domain-containing protein n=1 Tax=Vibrio sonorensis TaxID=1004316 RepID=UPI0008DA512D|nr:DUF4156 domain-containing protein [Vibrio sonorensis]
MNKSALVLFSSIGLLAGCTSPEVVLKPSSNQIEIRIDQQFDPDSCQWMGDVTGSVGHWYNYLFYPNDVMIRGAINDLRNNAATLGADTVYAKSMQDFATSMSLFGVAYKCR